MESKINKFGEKQVTWTSTKHIDNPDFMQIVKYMHVTKLDGETRLYWRLFNSSANDNHIIPNITLEDAIARFTDTEVDTISENEFQKWLKARNQ
jgi:hypothetical protein